MLTLASVPDHPQRVYNPKQPSIQRPMDKAPRRIAEVRLQAVSDGLS